MIGDTFTNLKSGGSQFVRKTQANARTPKLRHSGENRNPGKSIGLLDTGFCRYDGDRNKSAAR